MNITRPNPQEYARVGTLLLQEAVLEVLFQHHRNGRGLGAAEISRRAGIYRAHGAAGMNDAIVHGILNSLHDCGLVERGHHTWRLTQFCYNQRLAYFGNPQL